MDIGFIGLGKMGGNMVKRLLARDVRPTVYDVSKSAVQVATGLGAAGADSVMDVVTRLKERPRVVWLMLPAGEITENVFQEILPLLDSGDIIIDGGNSNFHESVRRAEEAKRRGLRMLDVGVSGGIVAADAGYAMMAGGDRSAFDHCRPLFEAMCQENGWGLVDERSGAGHFTKMVHNAIEYGMMQAIAEGFDLLERGSYEGLDLRETARIWNHGCIISSFLMQMVQSALDRDAKLSDLKPHVADSGEGRWAAFEAMERAVPFVANTYALQARHISRDDDSFAFRLLAAMRREFGGHTVKESPR